MRPPFATGVALALALPAFAGAQASAARSSPATPRAAAVALTRTPPAAPAAPATHPLPGHWVATVTNGFRGDIVHFTVSADGAELRDVQFVGTWKCGSAGASVALEQAQGGPPKPVPVRAGAFQSIQTRAAWWWEANGRFTSATTAEGSYRQAAKNAGCDTQRLRWTARRVDD